MNQTTAFERYRSLKNMCSKILEERGIRFAGIINKMGKLEVGGFREGVIPHEDSEKQKMMFMQFVLICNMRKECDDTSGQLDYVMTKRKKSKILCIPMNDGKLLLLSTEYYVDLERFAEKLGKIHSFGRDKKIVNNPAARRKNIEDIKKNKATVIGECTL